MKDPADTKTVDMLHQPKRRGRPPTGTAMSAAERKRKQRRADLNRSFSHAMSDGKPVTVTGLIEAIGRAAHAGHPSLVMQYAQQLADRISEAQAGEEKR